jgi:exopolysaccharide biosynthesis polyprenyl glycosylphosphotransferase
MRGTYGSSAEAATALTLPIELARDARTVTVPPSHGERFRLLRRHLFVADLLAAVVSALSIAAVGGVTMVQVPLVAGVLAVLWPAGAFACGLYAAEDLRTWASGVSEAPKLVLACLILSWPVFAILSALDAAHPVAGALAASGFTAAAAGLARSTVRMRLHRSPAMRQRTVIVGSGVVAGQLVSRLWQHAELGLEPVGFIDDHAHAVPGLTLPHLGGLDELPRLLADGGAERVMIAFTQASHDRLLEVIRLCRDAGVAVDVVPRLFEFLDGARTMDHIGGMPLLSINAPMFSPASRITKRALDVVLSLLAIIAVAPLILAIVVAIRIESRGPILFRQLRVGRHGRRFHILKFRSMHIDADARKPELAAVNDVQDGVMFKIYQDPRVTRVGRLLRRFSLDELPQLLNVLRGEMSLVGPRPLVVPEAEALTARWQGRRVDLRPGLTGPWQISGRSHIPFHEMVRYDYQYVAGWSLARDVEILLATIPAVLSGRGAY